MVILNECIVSEVKMFPELKLFLLIIFSYSLKKTIVMNLEDLIPAQVLKLLLNIYKNNFSVLLLELIL